MQWWCVGTGVPWDWRWQWYPGVHLMLIAVALLWWRLGVVQRWSRRPWLPFLTGWFLLLVSLDWPLGKLGAGYLASAHTAQYILLTMLVPPALLYAVPEEGWRRLVARPAGGWIWRLHPLIYMVIFTSIIVITHVPTVVDVGMKEQWGSFAIDFSWLIAGLMVWWPIVAPPALRRMELFASLAYLFTATVVPTIPAMMMVFADWPLYSLYELAPRFSVHFTPNDDLQLAGLTMKLIGDLPLWFAAAIIFFKRVAKDHG